MDAEVYALIKVAATVAGATATVISVIAKPLWSKLNKMEQGIDGKLSTVQKGLDGKLTTISTTVDGIRTRVGEQNGRLGKMETWATMHEQHDDERHKESIDRRREFVAAIEGLRSDLNEAMKDMRHKPAG